VEFQGNGANLKGYLSRPTGPGPHPAVLVIHENRGLLPHFPDVTRRLAVEGYAALAIDMLSREGGTGTFADTGVARRGMLCERSPETRPSATPTRELHTCRPRTLSAGSGWESWVSALAAA
jgi:dienelactone hydrolase